MKPERAMELLRDFTYKPNVSIEVAGGPKHLSIVCLRITMLVPDSTRSFQPVDVESEYEEQIYPYCGKRVITTYYRTIKDQKVIPVTGTFYVPRSVKTEDQFWQWLRGTLADLETHELDEWFKVRGKPLRDPHADATV